MADKVIDFQAAKDRMQKKPTDEFSMAKEIECSTRIIRLRRRSRRGESSYTI